MADGSTTADNRDAEPVLETLRQINRELLVAAGANVPDAVTAELDAARAHVLNAINALADPARQKSAEEIAPAEFKAKADDASRAFRDMLNIAPDSD
jgi:hypothetical protein